MFDLDRWNEIWHTIARNRKRSIMTAFGVFWGIFMLIVLLGAGFGIGLSFRSQLGDMATNICFYSTDQTSVPYKGMPAGRWWQMHNDDMEALRQIDGVANVAGLYWASEFHCSHGDRKGDFMLMGYSPDYRKIDPQTLVAGRFINAVDMERRRKVCVISDAGARQLFPGEADATGQTLLINGAYFRVVGVQKQRSGGVMFSDPDRTVILPITLAQQLFGHGDRVHMVVVAGDEDADSEALEEACRSLLLERHQIAPDDRKAVFKMSVAEQFHKIMGVFRGITLLTWIVGLGTLLAGMIGVSNIMLVIVRERTQEIGIRRALGARPRAIIAQILSESFILTFIAGILGLAAAVGVLSVVDRVVAAAAIQSGHTPVSFQITFGLGVSAALILVAGSLLAGMIPAGRALKIKAVDAIREE